MKNPFRKIDFKKFKALMVDFDGTITEKGVNQIDPGIVKEFARLLKADFPVAICTGRQLDSFKRRIKPLHEYLEKHRLLSKLKNLYLIAENGAIGYYYDPTTKRYKIFHKADWPKDFPKKKFETGLIKATKKFARLLDHKIPIVLRPKDMELNVHDTYKMSDEIYKSILKYIKKFPYKNTRKIMHVGNSGLGCLVCPANADKDSGIKAFHDFLFTKRDVQFNKKDKHIREIIVVGDNPQKGGNDHYFLNGKYGTAFSVCERCREKFFKMPYLVRDEKGKLLFNNKGTLFLVKRLKNLSS